MKLGKKKWRCDLDGKEFSTLNIMRAHFEKHYKEQAMEWFEQQGGIGGEAQAMEEMMQAMMMMGSSATSFAHAAVRSAFPDPDSSTLLTLTV